MDRISLGSLAALARHEETTKEVPQHCGSVVRHTDKLPVCGRLGHPIPGRGCSYTSVLTGSAPAGLQPTWKITAERSSPEHSPAGAGVMLQWPPAALRVGSGAHGDAEVSSALRQLPVPWELGDTAAAPKALLALHGHLPAQDQGCMNNALEKCMF